MLGHRCQSLQLLIIFLKGQFTCDDLGRTRMKVCVKQCVIIDEINIYKKFPFSALTPSEGNMSHKKLDVGLLVVMI